MGVRNKKRSIGVPSSFPHRRLRSNAWPFNRQMQSEFGSRAFLGEQQQRAAVLLDGFARHGEAKARAFLAFGAEEGIEDSLLNFRGDARPVVLDDGLDPLRARIVSGLD